MSATICMIQGLPRLGGTATWLAVIAVFIAARSPTVVQAGEKDEILAAWRERQEHWDSVRFRFAGTRTTAADYSESQRDPNDRFSPIDRYPTETRSCECPGLLVLDFKHGRVRTEETGETFSAVPDAPPAPAPWHEILVFDSERYQAYRPKEGNLSADMVQREVKYTQLYNSTELLRPGFPVPHRPLLLACGELVAAESTMISDIGKTFPTEDFEIGDTVEFQGVPCTILRTSPNEKGRYREYWVETEDPRKIVRYDVYRAPESGGLWLSMTIEYEPIDGEPIPHRWEVTQYSFVTGKPRTYVCRLESFEANPELADSEFVIEEEPGMIVHDSSRPREDRRYVASAPGQPEVPFLEFVRREEAAKEQSRNWLLYGLLAIGTLLLLAAWLRHRRRLA